MKQLFLLMGILLLVPLWVHAAEQQYGYCDIGADPVDENRPFKRDEWETTLEKDTLVDMGTGSGRIVPCWVRKGETIVANNSGRPYWIRRCGNPISGREPIRTTDNSGLTDLDQQILADTSREDVGGYAHLDPNGPDTYYAARSREWIASVPKVNLNFGAYWQHRTGVSDDVTLTNTQSQSQSTSGRGGSGGSGGSSSTKTIVRNDGGGNGGGDPGGPEDPNNPPSNNGGGPVDPNNGPVDPNNP